MSIAPSVPPATLSLLPRGNLLLQSQSFNTTWTATGCAVTANTTADPLFGLITGDTLTRSTAGASNLSQALAKSATAQVYTLSLYAEAGGNSFVALGLQGASSANRADVCFNLATGAVSLLASLGGAFTGISVTVTPVAGSWYRLSLTAMSDASNAIAALISTASVSQKVDGTGSAGSGSAILWGAQLEPYAQSSAYAATTAAADPGIWAGANGLPVLPYLAGQNVDVGKSPRWSTKVARATSGRERRTAHWPYPLWQFELSYGVIRHRPTNDELTVLWEFFNALQGQFASWLFVDPTDCQVPASTPARFGTGDGATATFQLGRFLNSVFEPVYGAYQPVILDNGVPTASGVSFGPGGTVTFATAPASGHALSWFGYFYFLCRFDADDAAFVQIVQQLWEGKSLKFTSLRP